MRLTLLIFILLSPLTQANTSPDWNCQIFASLKGRATYYIYYGRDSWGGEGSLYCESGHANVYRKVSVFFNSRSVGFGADPNSSLEILGGVKTKMSPSELQIRAIVDDNDSGPRVSWSFASELIEAKVYIVNATESPATQSLQTGSLYIRSAGE